MRPGFARGPVGGIPAELSEPAAAGWSSDDIEVVGHAGDAGAEPHGGAASTEGGTEGRVGECHFAPLHTAQGWVTGWFRLPGEILQGLHRPGRRSSCEGSHARRRVELPIGKEGDPTKFCLFSGSKATEPKARTTGATPPLAHSEQWLQVEAAETARWGALGACTNPS